MANFSTNYHRQIAEISALDLNDAEASLHISNLRTLITMYTDLSSVEKRDLLSMLIKADVKARHLSKARSKS